MGDQKDSKDTTKVPITKYMGGQCPSCLRKSRTFDGSEEGMATIELNGRDKFNGCIIHNNADLKCLLESNEKYGNEKFFIYFYSQEDLSQINKAKIVAPRHNTTHKKDKECTINNPCPISIACKLGYGHHIFLPASKYFKSSKFLKECGKYLLSDDPKIKCDKNYIYKGVQHDGRVNKFMEITLQSKDGKLVLGDNDFDKLIDGPLILSDGEKQPQLVGWCAKSSDSSKITVHMLNKENKQETVDIFKSSLEGNLGHQDTVDSHQSQGDVEIHQSQVTFCELYEYDSGIVFDLSLEFDKKSQTIKPITTLADKLGAPRLIKDKCRSNYNHSPACLVLDNTKVASDKITKLVSVLRGMEKEHIASLIEARNLDEGQSIKDFFSTHYELKEEVTTKLEAEDDSSWRLLGKKFEVEDHYLDSIERGTNPAENFLVNHAYKAVPREKLQICRFREDMKNLGRKDEVESLLKSFNITSDDDTKTLYEVFKPHTERMEELCKLLNKTDTCQGWLHLAALWEVDPIQYLYYIPDTKASATRILFNWLMMQKEEFTVDELLKILREMGREHAYECLRKKKDEYLVKKHSASDSNN